MKPNVVLAASGIPVATDPLRPSPVGAAEGCDLLILILNSKIKRSQPSAAPTGGSASQLIQHKLHSRHLKGLPLEINGLASQMLADAGVMAFAHHELSVENAVIPFSLSLPTSTSQVGPVTFEMEQSHR
ncbi:hypothetical protein [Pseudomonas frederiksbergensis]|uniref:hypothetical protein n=1 Tax=Pseudomonas frederiksbergensis TaxID=104087 RepID=UPI0011CE2111|nr:hypothetical protein [Pseudomonas frederiksbergensis]